MRRSTINEIIKDGLAFFESHQFKLPPFAFWKPEDWREKGPECRAIVEQQLGWDITDFGSGDFSKIGLFLFTLRNGTLEELDKPEGKIYAEKIMMVREDQVTPTHFHYRKMEDIINRGGGNLLIQVWKATESAALADTGVTLLVDGVRVSLKAGDTLRLTPGESVCLSQRLYHNFRGEAGKGTVLVGEVSRVNDDHADNRFYEPAGRFPEIEEDVAPLHLLCNDYHAYYHATP